MSEEYPIGAPIVGVFLVALTVYSLYQNEVEMAMFVLALLTILTVGTYYLVRRY